MSRQLKKETVQNLSSHFGKLQNAVALQEQLVAENERAVKDGSAATPEGMQKFVGNMSKVERARIEASESAQYLGNIFGAFLADIGQRTPSVLVPIAEACKAELPNIVEAINAEKETQRVRAKEAQSAKIQAAAQELLDRMNSAKVAKK